MINICDIIDDAICEGNHNAFAEFYYSNAKLPGELFEKNVIDELSELGVKKVSDIYKLYKVGTKHCSILNKLFWNDPKFTPEDLDEIDVNHLYQIQSLNKGLPSREAIIQLGLLLQKDKKTVDKWLLSAEQEILYLLETQDLVCAFYLDFFAKAERDLSMEAGYNRIMHCKLAMNRYLTYMVDNVTNIHAGLTKIDDPSDVKRLYVTGEKRNVRYLAGEMASIEKRIASIENCKEKEEKYLWDVMTYFSNDAFTIDRSEEEFDAYVKKEIESNIVFSRRYGLYRAFSSLYHKSINQEKQYWNNEFWPLYEGDDEFSFDDIGEFRGDIRPGLKDSWNKMHKGVAINNVDVLKRVNTLMRNKPSLNSVDLILKGLFTVEEKNDIDYAPRKNDLDSARKGFLDWRKKVKQGDWIRFNKKNIYLVLKNDITGEATDCIELLSVKDGEWLRENRLWEEIYRYAYNNNQLYNCKFHRNDYYEKAQRKKGEDAAWEHVLSYVDFWWNKLVVSFEKSDKNKNTLIRAEKRNLIWRTLIGRKDYYFEDGEVVPGYTETRLSKVDLWKMVLATGQEDEVMSLWAAAGFNSLDGSLSSPKQLWKDDMSAVECIIAYAFSYRDRLIDEFYNLGSQAEKNRARKEFPMVRLIHEISLSLEDNKIETDSRNLELSKMILLDYDLL